jgi:dTDP-4-amino-4,6-dideoxygalactose transaminase
MSVKNPHAVTRDFEKALCDYAGAKYAVATNSCTAAIMLATAWHLRDGIGLDVIEIPNRTYVSVPMSIIHAGGRVSFRDEEWSGAYQLKPLPVWDSARRFTSGMFAPGQMQCVSFHWSKILGVQQGGCILHDDDEADAWLRRARFDGRAEGVDVKEDTFTQIGFHCYMSPEVSAQGLMRLSFLPLDNCDLPNSDYPDLSKIGIFK